MLTVITEAFGVRGENGSLAIAPKLVREQFGEAGTASLALPFAGKRFQVIAVNLSRKVYGEFRLEKAYLTTADGPQMRRLTVARTGPAGPGASGPAACDGKSDHSGIDVRR